ncbi:MAG: CopD family protein [Pseudomonadales bacterium]|nr:CopD family protein [Pseudomonadales bacterium]
MEMSTIPNAWETASLLCKFLFYLGAASSLGGALSLLLYGDGRRQSVQRILLYQLIGGLLGFQAVLLNFLVQVGQINNSGIAGAFDWGMAQILLDTPLGDLSLYRLAAFALIIATSAAMLRQSHLLSAPPQLNFYKRNLVFHCLSFGLLLFSFRYGGHVSVLALSVQVVLAVHFTAFAIWIGALYPLYEFSNSTDTDRLQIVLKQFGDHAVFFVGALLVAGVILTLNLIHSPAELLTSPYGRTLSIKLLLVAALLGIAAINKLRLVPQLLASKGLQGFRKSLRVEVGVASVLLLVTAYFSTVVDPMNHM